MNVVNIKFVVTITTGRGTQVSVEENINLFSEEQTRESLSDQTRETSSTKD